MDFYDNEPKVYKHLVSIVGFIFFKQIKDSGIVLKSIFKGEDIASNKLITLLEYEEDDELKWIKICNKHQFIFNIKKVAKARFERIKWEEQKLLKINNTEEYGESRYFNETEMAAINLGALEDLLVLLEDQLKKENR